MWRRLKNLWLWSGINPNDAAQNVVWNYDDYKPPKVLHVPRETGAQILYPNKREELLKVKEDPTLDELLNV